MDIDNGSEETKDSLILVLQCHACKTYFISLSPNTTLCDSCERKVGTALKKTRKPYISKQRREREFRSWLTEWTAAYRVRKAGSSTIKDPSTLPSSSKAPTLSPSSLDTEDVTDYWRISQMRRMGGTTYPTADAFFEALRGRVLDQSRALKDGTSDEVLQFCARYSIVAQPRIKALVRLRRVAKRVREIGLQ